jgi:hypothetical protein
MENQYEYGREQTYIERCSEAGSESISTTVLKTLQTTMVPQTPPLGHPKRLELYMGLTRGWRTPTLSTRED